MNQWKQNREESMSRWRHSICDDCWTKTRTTRTPVRLKPPDLEPCCYCMQPHTSGIYVREDPEETACQGKHVKE